MNILAFDTATDACSVALKVDEQIYSRHEIAPRMHAQLLLPIIQSLLDEAKITLPALNAVAFGCGPGSFMGVRLATGMAQGLAFGLSIPVISVSTLQVIAQSKHEETGEKSIAAGWDARMGEVYWGFYTCDSEGVMQSAQPETLCTLEEIDKNRFAAVGSTFAGNIFSDDTYPDAKAMLTIAQSKFLRNEVTTPADAHPQYIRHHVVHNHTKL
jgi:tRNA threonylcarbamoyladenosine biosynthesis protein TsaB